MTCIDVNLLMQATDPRASKHEVARPWFEDVMNSGQLVGMPWATLLAFVRLSTDGASRRPALSIHEALLFMEEWLEWETVWIPEPTQRHHQVIAELLRHTQKSRLVSDAHLAALAIEHGLTLCTADADFRMFPGLKVHNPLSQGRTLVLPKP